MSHKSWCHCRWWIAEGDERVVWESRRDDGGASAGVDGADPALGHDAAFIEGVLGVVCGGWSVDNLAGCAVVFDEIEES